MKFHYLFLVLNLFFTNSLFAQKDTTAAAPADILSKKVLTKQHYEQLPSGMCAVKFNPSDWSDNFFDGVSDQEYFEEKPDSLQVVPDQMPMFPDGLDGLFFFVYNNTVYPNDALRKKISGRVIMAIDIDAKGDVVEVTTIKAEYPSFGKAAEDVLYDLPKLNPAIKDGAFIPIRLYLPMKFSIN